MRPPPLLDFILRGSLTEQDSLDFQQLVLDVSLLIVFDGTLHLPIIKIGDLLDLVVVFFINSSIFVQSSLQCFLIYLIEG